MQKFFFGSGFFLLFAMLFSAVLHGSSQSQVYRLERFSVEQGLSQSSVQTMCQDQLGFMWFGTRYGLNRFDGYEFVEYPLVADDRQGISKRITSIMSDSGGRIWVGVDEGAVGFIDPTNGRFSLLKDLSSQTADEPVVSFAEPRPNEVWIALRHRLVVTQADGSFSVFRIPGEEIFEIRDMIAGEFKDIWVGTDKGLLRLRLEDAQLKITSEFLDGVPTVDLELGELGQVWVATARNGLFRVDARSNQVNSWSLENSEISSNNLICAMWEASNGRLWLGSLDAGIEIYWPEQLRFEQFFGQNDEAKIAAFSFFFDHSGVVWIGTHGSGVLKHAIDTERFNHLKPLKTRTQETSDVATFIERDDGMVLVGSFGSGISIFDPMKSRIEVNPNYSTFDGLSTVTFLNWDSSTVLVGTVESGLWRIDGSKTEAIPLGLDEPKPISTMLRTADNDVWVATNGLGIVILDDSFERVGLLRDSTSAITNDRVWELFQDHRGAVWVGTAEGVSVYKDPGNPFADSDQNPTSRGTAFDVVFEDSKANMWFGTSAGLRLLPSAEVDRFLFGKSGPNWTYFNEKDGLSNNLIYGIVEDDSGDLWISTNRGLSNLDCETNQFSNFYVEDGLQSNEFNSGAVMRLSTGPLLFGGINGFNIFRPDQIQPSDYRPPLVITSLKAGSSEMNATFPAYGLERLDLDMGDSVSLRFAALDYANSNRIKYAYRRKGIRDEWVELGGKHELDLIDLQPGQFALEIKATNRDGIWSDENLTLDILVPTPFWMTTWFRVLVVFAAGLLLNGLFVAARRIGTALMHWKRSMFVGPYRIESEVGKGGMATVFKATDLTNRQVVAVKVLDQFTPDETRKKRFLQESTICERLDHPNIIQIFTKGEHAQKVYYSMEYVEGQTLRKLIEKGPFNPTVAVLVAHVTMRVLKYIHDQGIIHRDLKPENIMMTRCDDVWASLVSEEKLAAVGRGVKLLDFGLAKAVGFETITRSGVLAGTIAYLPPECVSGKETASGHVDFYALGIILYEMLIGQNPYAGGDYMSVVYSILKRNPLPPNSIDPLIPIEISEFVMALIEKERQFRLCDGDEILLRLTQLLESEISQGNDGVGDVAAEANT